MHIVHTEASCGWGGQEIRILSESAGMIARGHRVTLLCPPEARIFTEAPRFGVPVVALPIGKKRLPGFFAMRAWLKANPVDVINTHSSTDSWLAAVACATLGKAPPIVRTRHISAAVANNATTRWLYTSATKHIATTGEALREQLIRDNGYPAAQITSVPTGIDPNTYAPGDKAAARAALSLNVQQSLVVIVATLRSWKGHVYLLEALAQTPGVQLAIVGDGPYRPTIEQRVDELGLRDRVMFAGQQNDVTPWLHAADVFVLPSYANEGVPQAVLQAMMSGLPVISTTVGAISEAVVDGLNGVILAPRDSDALAQALQSLLSDSTRAAQMGTAGRERAMALFSHEAMLNRMQTIFDRVTARA